MATKKAKVTVKSKKSSALKKSAAKKTSSDKKIKKKSTSAKKVSAVKKVAPKKTVKIKAASKKSTSAKKTLAENIVGKRKITISPKAVAKVEEIVFPKITREKPKKLSVGQQKKVSARKKISEQESLLRDTYTGKEKSSKSNLPIDHITFKLVKSIVNAIEEKKGDNIVCLDIRNIENRVCDYFIICDGTSSTQIDAIGESVEF